MSDQMNLAVEWAGRLASVPEVALVWVEGSLATGGVVSSSDVDLFVAVNDHSLPSLWVRSKKRILDELKLAAVTVDTNFVRGISDNGYVVDIECLSLGQSYLRLSSSGAKIIYRRPDVSEPSLEPDHREIAGRFPARIVSAPELARWSYDLIAVMAAAPTPILRGEKDSSLYYLDLYRVELVRLLYLCVGVRYAVSYKRLSAIFSKEYREKLHATYPVSFDFPDISRAMCNLFLSIGECLEELSRSSGGFDRDLYRKVYDRMTSSL